MGLILNRSANCGIIGGVNSRGGFEEVQLLWAWAGRINITHIPPL